MCKEYKPDSEATATTPDEATKPDEATTTTSDATSASTSGDELESLDAEARAEYERLLASAREDVAEVRARGEPLDIDQLASVAELVSFITGVSGERFRADLGVTA